jgi:glutamyl-tRNA reductase
MIVCVGLSHRNAPVEVREQLALTRDDVPTVIEELRRTTPAAEIAVLSTCNRVEVYAALPRGEKADLGRLEETSRAIASRLAARGGPAVAPALVRRHGPDALRHLFRVASSLDSLVLGEPQILGQLKDAVHLSTQSGGVGPTLSRALHKALTVGKRVRTETQIGSGQVSVSSVAVELACQIFGDLAGRSAVMVGAGEMAESAAKLLVKQGAKLVVVNRSPERAKKLATEVGGEPKDWGELNWCLLEADIVVTSTSSPTFVITESTLKTAKKARRGRNLFLIDIAVPRDVDPAVESMDGVYLYDIDDLEQIVSESLAGRGVEAARAEKIVDGEVTAYDAKETELTMNPTIVGLRARVHAVLVAELERSLSGKLKSLGQAERQALGVMLEAATNKLCHRPSARLRALAADPRGQEYVETLRDLFDLPDVSDGTDGPDGASARSPSVAPGAREPRHREKEPS